MMAEEAGERSRLEIPQSSAAEGSLGRSVASGLLSAVFKPVEEEDDRLLRNQVSLNPSGD